jgi:hypothetical protein
MAFVLTLMETLAGAGWWVRVRWRARHGAGQRIGQILCPRFAATYASASKRNRLFMTASQSLYAVYVETKAHISANERRREDWEILRDLC